MTTCERSTKIDAPQKVQSSNALPDGSTFSPPHCGQETVPCEPSVEAMELRSASADLGAARRAEARARRHLRAALRAEGSDTGSGSRRSRRSAGGRGGWRLLLPT